MFYKASLAALRRPEDRHKRARRLVESRLNVFAFCKLNRLYGISVHVSDRDIITYAPSHDVCIHILAGNKQN